MKLSSFARVTLCVAALLMSSAALAAKKDTKKGNEYPNTTRAEPKAEMSAAAQRDLSKANELLNDGQAAKALPLVEKAIASKKLSPYAEAYGQQLLSSIYWEQDNEPAALAALTKAIELNALPNEQHFALIYQLAQMQAQDEKYDQALATLTRWERESGNPLNADKLALKGNIFYRLDKYQEAIDTMKAAIAASDKPNDSWNQILMASYFELEQYDQAAQMVQASLAKNPDDIKAIKQLAMIYIQADNYPKAIEVLAGAKSRGLITSADDYMQLAKLYANAEKGPEAIATLKEGLDKGVLQPSFEVYKLQGDLCAQSDQDACAIEAYKKASPMAQDGNVDYQLGYVLIYAGRAQEARDAFASAIAKGGLRQQGEAYVLKGDAEDELGNAAAARADWQKGTTFPSSKAMADQRLKAASAGVKMKRAPKK